MMMQVDTLEIKTKFRRLWHRQRDRYATPRCVRVKTSGKGVQPFLWLSPAPVAVSAEKAGRLTEAARRSLKIGRNAPPIFSPTRTAPSERPSFPHFLSYVSLSKLVILSRPRATKIRPAKSHTTMRSSRFPATSLQRQEAQTAVYRHGRRKNAAVLPRLSASRRCFLGWKRGYLESCGSNRRRFDLRLGPGQRPTVPH